MKKISYLIPLFANVLLLSACGGGSSENQSVKQEVVLPKNYVEISGSAFAESAIANTQVTASCKDDLGFKEIVTTDQDGYWTGEIEAKQLPCKLQVKTPDQNYHSYIADINQKTININPLTDLTLAIATQQHPNDWYTSRGTISDAQLDLAIKDLQKILQEKGYNLDEKNDYFYQVTKENDNIHQTIKDLLFSLSSHALIKDYDALLLLVKDGNLNQIPSYINPKPIFYGDELDFNSCSKSNLQDSHTGKYAKNLYHSCSDTVMKDFMITDLIDVETGNACSITKKDKTLILNTKDKEIQAPFEGTNSLSYSQGFSFISSSMIVAPEFGQIVFKERELELKVSAHGEITQVFGQSTSPDQNIVCRSAN